MRSLVLVFALAAGCGSSPRASAPPVEPWARFRIGMDLGAAFSRADGTRQDAAPLIELVPSAVIKVQPRWRLAVGLGLPAGPAALQLPIALERVPLRGGLVPRLGVRPTLGSIDVCTTDPEPCPRAQAVDDPHGAGGVGLGVFGEAGLGYRFAFSRGEENEYEGARPDWFIDVRLSYLAGGWLARWSDDAERPLGGLWQGFVFGVDLTF